MEPDIGLTTEQRREVAQILSIVLADEFVLYTKTRNYHWNVMGERFFGLHAVFDEQYARLNEIVDEIAERIRALGGHAVGTLHEILQVARLSEQPEEWPDEKQMLSRLLGDYEQLIRDLRMDSVLCGEKHGGAGTRDYLTNLMVEHEKTAWMLRSTLNRNVGVLTKTGPAAGPSWWEERSTAPSAAAGKST